MPNGPDADTTEALSELCTQVMDMAGAVSEDSPLEDAAALEVSEAADSEAEALPEAFD